MPVARNKYPEEAVEKILDVAERPFMERGNEHTTMADIVESLGGLTKVAVYHHFKKKDKIFEAVFERATRGVVARARQFLPLSHTGKIYTVWGILNTQAPTAPSTDCTRPFAFAARVSGPTRPTVFHLRQNECTYICVYIPGLGICFSPRRYTATYLPTYTPTELHAVAQLNRKSALQRRSQAKRFVIIQNPKQPNREDCQLRQPV